MSWFTIVNTALFILLSILFVQRTGDKCNNAKINAMGAVSCGLMAVWGLVIIYQFQLI